HEDISLRRSKLGARWGESDGGHTGLRDIKTHVATPEYARLRIGVGAPDEDDAIDHVLGRFRPVERPVIEEAIQTAAQAVLVWVQHGIEVCMNQYNAGSETRPGKSGRKSGPKDEGPPEKRCLEP